MRDLEIYIKKHLKEQKEEFFQEKKELLKDVAQEDKTFLGMDFFRLSERIQEDWIKEEMDGIYTRISASQEKFFTSEEKKNLYKVFPFYIKYETMFKGKAKYNEIYNLFEKHYSKDLDYAVGLLDSLENTSEEIFEYYRGLQLLLKKLATEILKKGRDVVLDENLDKESLLKITYVVLKGVDLGHLDEEYLSAGLESYTRYLSK